MLRINLSVWTKSILTYVLIYIILFNITRNKFDIIINNNNSNNNNDDDDDDVNFVSVGTYFVPE